MGQSNMVGGNVGGLSTFLPNVSVWNGLIGRSDLQQIGSQFVAPNLNAAPFYSGRNTPSIQFANKLAAVMNDDVRLIVVADGGNPISSWYSSSGKGPLYQRLDAVMAAAGVSSVDVFVWQQGESDNAAASAYAAKWNALLGALEADGYISASTPIVMGECSPQYEAINTVIRQIGDSSSRVNVARTSHYPTSDGTHFVGEATEDMGGRYLRALSCISGPFYGIMDMPEDSFSANRQSGMSIPVGVYTKLIMESVNWDPSGAYDKATGTWRPKKGAHQVSAQVRFNNYSQGGFIYLSLFRNDMLFREVTKSGAFAHTNGSKTDTLTLQLPVDADGTDRFDLRVKCDIGNPNVWAVETMGWFSAYKIT